MVTGSSQSNREAEIILLLDDDGTEKQQIIFKIEKNYRKVSLRDLTIKTGDQISTVFCLQEIELLNYHTKFLNIILFFVIRLPLL